MTSRLTSFLALLPILSFAACSASSHDDGATSSNAAVRTCATGATVEGIDVSEYQPDVDWDAVKASGRKFAFIRVSDGSRYLDSEFARHWKEAKRVGVLRGVYQFFRPAQDAAAQADILLNALDGDFGELPPVIDVESDDGQGSAAIVGGMQTWLDRVQARVGRKPMVYTAVGFWDGLSGTSRFASYPLWVANYGVSCPYAPDTWQGWKFWQYSESGSVSGVPGGVDVNVFNGTLAELGAFAGVPSATLAPIEVYWAREPNGSYDLRALTGSGVARVDYFVDGYPIGSAVPGATQNFPASYAFSMESSARLFEARGFDGAGKQVALGVGSIDVTADTAVYIREMGDHLYEIGLERPPAGVAAIEVTADDRWLLADSVSGESRSTRNAVRYTFGDLGARRFSITTFDASGQSRGTLYRSFTLR